MLSWGNRFCETNVHRKPEINDSPSTTAKKDLSPPRKKSQIIFARFSRISASANARIFSFSSSIIFFTASNGVGSGRPISFFWREAFFLEMLFQYALLGSVTHGVIFLNDHNYLSVAIIH